MTLWAVDGLQRWHLIVQEIKLVTEELQKAEELVVVVEVLGINHDRWDDGEVELHGLEGQDVNGNQTECAAEPGNELRLIVFARLFVFPLTMRYMGVDKLVIVITDALDFHTLIIVALHIGEFLVLNKTQSKNSHRTGLVGALGLVNFLTRAI